MICALWSRLGQDNAGLWNNRPFLLRDVVLVNINVIAIGIEIAVEHQGRVHEGARIDKTSSLLYLHLLHVENKTSIENMECHCTLASKQNNLIVCNLVSQTHVRWHPFGLVNFWSG